MSCHAIQKTNPTGSVSLPWTRRLVSQACERSDGNIRKAWPVTIQGGPCASWCASPASPSELRGAQQLQQHQHRRLMSPLLCSHSAGSWLDVGCGPPPRQESTFDKPWTAQGAAARSWWSETRSVGKRRFCTFLPRTVTQRWVGVSVSNSSCWIKTEITVQHNGKHFTCTLGSRINAPDQAADWLKQGGAIMKAWERIRSWI